MEVGAGCGALTGLFCQKVSKVTAVEGTDRRAQIIYNRHKNHHNLEISLGNINDMEFEEKFDYIVLCDVLEYASQFTQTDNPYSDFLKKIKTMLSEDGVILLAIENRLGLKYFSGSNEDHLGQSFLGIDDYPNINHVRTFSRFELEELIQDAGFSEYKFFYPYPDHKFPVIIHTDEFVDELPFLKDSPNFGYEKIKFFDEGSLNVALAKDNISKFFANSFLVEIRNSDIFHESEKVKYCKLGNFRGEEFRIGTKILKVNDDLIVSKFPLNQKAVKHMEKMYLHSKRTFGKIRCLEGVFEDNILYYPYLKELDLSQVVTNLLVKDSDKKEVIEIFKKIYDSLKFNSIENDSYHDDQFSEVLGEKRINGPLHCHEVSNIDLILNNLFIIDNEIVAIDYEWCYDFPIPIEFIFWRIISFEKNDNQVFKKFITVEENF